MSVIAVIDDDEYIGSVLEKALHREGYEVIRAYSGTEALMLLERTRPDLILLDLMMPGLPGEEVLTKVGNIPVIVVSAKVGIDDKVRLLLEGAADYVTKPFHIQELLARIAVQLRKKAKEDEILEYEELRMDLSRHQIFSRQREIHLTRTEFAILKQLMRNPSRVITKSNILDAISLDTPDCTEGSLKIHISNLRKKLKETAGKDYIESVWGIGFKMRQES